MRMAPAYLYITWILIILTFEEHYSEIYSIIQLEDGRLCSCACDWTIKLWNIESGQCEQTIYGHTHEVTCAIQLMDGRLCSGSCDSTIKVWSKDNEECKLTISTQYAVRSSNMQ
jgi:WD40 repeat protein